MGGLGRFLPHLPSQAECKGISFAEGLSSKHIACQNVDTQVVLFGENRVPVLLMRTMADIKKGQVIGCNYGLKYWSKFGCQPGLMTHHGVLMPRSDYNYTGGEAVFLLDGGDIAACLEMNIELDHLQSRFESRRPGGVGPFSVDGAGEGSYYMSVYSLMDQCADRKIFSEYHGRLLELNAFSHALAQCFVQRGLEGDTDVACYWAQPSWVEKESKEPSARSADAMERFFSVDTVVHCGSRESAEVVRQMLQPIVDQVSYCQHTLVFRIKSVNVADVSDKLHGFISKLYENGQRDAAGCRRRGKKPVAREVGACGMRLFPAASGAARQRTDGGGSGAERGKLAAGRSMAPK